MTCPECCICIECKGTAYCLSTPGAKPPCPHFPNYCDLCRLELCEDCIENVEAMIGSEPPC